MLPPHREDPSPGDMTPTQPPRRRESYGRGAVQLQLITDAILTLSREGFRDAMQRTPASAWHDERSRSSLLRVAWLSLPLSLVIASAILAWSPLEAQAGAAAVLFSAAALTEMIAEPLYIMAHNLLLIHVRVRVEMLALSIRSAHSHAVHSACIRSPPLAHLFRQPPHSKRKRRGLPSTFRRTRVHTP